jgi:putative transposase
VAQLHKEAAVVEQVCRVLQVSRSGYYAARKKASAAPKICLHSAQLKAEFEASGKSYGSRRLCAALKTRGVSIGLYRVRKLMSEQRLRPVWKRKFVVTTDSRHALPRLPNVLARRFDPPSPNQAWVADITYIRTQAGWLYLAVVLDLYSRKIVGWAMASAMETALVCSALHMAIAQRRPEVGLVVHSDQGCQYASSVYQKLLSVHGLVGSMSRKGNCWDNAVMERFFLSLKTERVWLRDYANHSEATRDIADYIVGFYNSARLHSTLGNLPPNAYERKTATHQPIAVS